MRLFSLSKGRFSLMVVSLLALAAIGYSFRASAQGEDLDQVLANLSATAETLQTDVTHLHDAVHELEGRVDTLEAATGQLSMDVWDVGPSRAQFLPNPPPDQVTVQFLALSQNASVPGEFTFHLAPEGAELFATQSVGEGESVEIGPEIENGVAFVEPGKLYRLQVVYRNPTDTEVNFLVRGGLIDPKAALPFVRNRCWCASIPFSAPPKGVFSRIIEVGVGPDTPPGAKAIVVFPVVSLAQSGK